MNNLSNLYLKRIIDTSNPNSVFEFVRNSSDDKNVILKEIDTITFDEDYLCYKKSSFEEEFYSVRELICKKNFIGKQGYYEDMTMFEKLIYKELILMYKDEVYELLYDELLGNIFLGPSIYNMENFTVLKDKNVVRKRK